MNDNALTLLLENWGRVLRVYPQMHTCMSIEGRYNIPREDAVRVAEELDEPIPAIVPRFIQPAWDVERAWRMVPWLKHRRLLMMLYVSRRALPVACRRAGISERAFDRHHRDARAELALRLSPAVMAMAVSFTTHTLVHYHARAVHN